MEYYIGDSSRTARVIAPDIITACRLYFGLHPHNRYTSIWDSLSSGEEVSEEITYREKMREDEQISTGDKRGKAAQA